jgi:hypothetical protein
MQLAHAHYRDIPGWTQKYDYGARTDGQPVYHGRALNGASEDDPDWIITYYTYNGSDFIGTAICKIGSWTDRATLFV